LLLQNNIIPIKIACRPSIRDGRQSNLPIV
jgi:hypothetical protein